MKRLVPVVLVVLALGIISTTMAYAQERNVSSGEASQIDHMGLKVHSALMVSTLSQFTGAGNDPNDGTKWEVINVTVKNNGKKAKLNLPKMYTLEIGNVTYKVAVNKDNELNHKKFFRLLQPNTVTSGYIAFNVPSAKGTLKLKFGTGRNTKVLDVKTFRPLTPHSRPARSPKPLKMPSADRNALDSLSASLDFITNTGQLHQMKTNTLEDLKTTEQGAKTVYADLKMLDNKMTKEKIGNASYSEDINNAVQLYNKAIQQRNVYAANYLDKLVAELDYAAYLQSNLNQTTYYGRYYALSHVEGHGKAIDNFLSNSHS